MCVIAYLQIFTCILSLRSNEYCQVGCLDGGPVVKFSPFFVCRQSRCDDHTHIITPMLLDYRSTFSAVLACLEKVRVMDKGLGGIEGMSGCGLGSVWEEERER